MAEGGCLLSNCAVFGTEGSNPSLSELEKMEHIPQEETSVIHNPSFLAILITYFPFFGWLIPYTFKNDDSFWLEHSKQGFVLAVFFISVSVFLNLVNLFLPHEWDVFRLAVVIIIYAVYLVYFFLCVYCMLTAYKGREAGIIFIQNIVRKFDF